jgi:phosphoglycolate phosphatase-like HAD superfamily hydrolase
MLAALIFDLDGTLADTELDLPRFGRLLGEAHASA